MKLPHTLVNATALVSTLIACSLQGQGERCLTANANADCEVGLVCTSKDELADVAYAADRCCPPIDGPRWSDARCERKALSGAGGSVSSTTGAGGAAAGSDNSTSSGGVAGSSDAAQAGAATAAGEAGGSASTDPSDSTAAAGNGS
jgi:hypothetical protein